MIIRLETVVCKLLAKMTYDGLLRKVYGKAFDRKLFIIFFFNGIPNALITCTIAMMLYTPPYYRCNLPPYANDIIKEVNEH